MNDSSVCCYILGLIAFGPAMSIIVIVDVILRGGVARSRYQLMCDISTRADPSVWMWGGHRSLLAWLLAMLLWIVRLMSPLQMLKFLYRLRPAVSSSNLSKRTDVPPLITEIYFIMHAILLYILMSMRCAAPSVYETVVGWWLFSESVAWMLYYCVLRLYFEGVGNFSVFSRLEYLIVLPIAMWVQCGGAALSASPGWWH